MDAASSHKTFLTALVAIPPEELWEPIQVIRRAHDRHVRDWMPHLTLLYPFRLPEEFEAAAGQVAAAVAGLGPIPVRLATFRFFQHNPRSATTWLDPEPGEPWMRLHAALLAAFPDCTEASVHEGGFRPHLSVGQARGPELAARLQPGWPPLAFECRELALLRREAGAPFAVDRTVALGKG
ncbi:MAG: 2'-5' RNA ligase family protein [Planctomycetales bacterium]|nr:2'-5' RNA ligase family protein [Planctomycetales bacterium]